MTEQQGKNAAYNQHLCWRAFRVRPAMVLQNTQEKATVLAYSRMYQDRNTDSSVKAVT